MHRIMDFRERVFLAPLTKGGNLPFRRLCVAFGCQTTVSEMAYARQIVSRRPGELALLRKHESEPCFGVQIAASKPEDAVTAGQMAVERGAAFVDLNCGCPIHDVVRRGMGATLLQRPPKLGRILSAMADQLPVPVTAKIRLGWKESEKNASEIARVVAESGASAIAVHGRTREQRYSKAADWQWIARLVDELEIPVIGNGDLLTWYEARRLKEESGCASLMIGRGALIKPWLFREIEEQREYEPDAQQRVAIYLKLARFMKEHFRDDEKGRKRAIPFLRWHLGFLCRYRPLPEAEYRQQSIEHPLLQTRLPETGDPSLLEQLLRDSREEVHEALANMLWDAEDEPAAAAAALQFANEHPPVSSQPDEIATAHG